MAVLLGFARGCRGSSHSASAEASARQARSRPDIQRPRASVSLPHAREQAHAPRRRPSTARRPPRPPLVIAHGLFGSARNWGAIGKRLALAPAGDRGRHAQPRRQPAEPGARLRGDGRRTSRRRSPGAGGRADVLGHSMGGKAAMVLALTEPERVDRLIVADMAPVAYGHSQIDYVHAMQAARPRRRHPPLRGRRSAGRRRCPNRRCGRSSCRASPSTSGRRALEAQPRRARRAGCRRSWASPTSTAASTARRCSSPAPPPTTCARSTGPRIRALFPAAEHVAIPGAGHWLHADAPGGLHRGGHRLPRPPKLGLDACAGHW